MPKHRTKVKPKTRRVRKAPIKKRVHLKTIYLWQNNMVMSFGLDGEQVVVYQGTIKDVLPRLENVDADQWCIGEWGSGATLAVPRATWMVMAEARTA